MREQLGGFLAARQSQPTTLQCTSCSQQALFKAPVNYHALFVRREFSKHKFSSNLIF